MPSLYTTKTIYILGLSMLGLSALGLMLLNLQQAVLPLLLHQHLPYAHTSASGSASMSTQYVPSTIIISVIIPTYNFQDTKLLRAIKSVNNQVAVPPMAKALPPSEIIVVNDGSSESHFSDFADECKRRFPVSNTTGYDCKAGAHFILAILVYSMQAGSGSYH
jgi:cellulose synthase/poly-beta-1,6-N-acetylglucosamine synthase-like glycosyltransferase